MRGGSVYVWRKMCHSVINCHRSARLPRQPITTHTLTWILMEHTYSLSAPHHHKPYKLTPHHTQMSDLVPTKWTHSKLSKLLTCSLPDIINLLSHLPVSVVLFPPTISSSIPVSSRGGSYSPFHGFLAKINHHHPISTVRSILKFYSSLLYSAVQINTCFFCFHNINKVCCVQAGCHYSLLFKITHWDL